MQQMFRGGNREHPQATKCRFRGCARPPAGEATFVMEGGATKVVPLCHPHADQLAYGTLTDAELLGKLEP